MILFCPMLYEMTSIFTQVTGRMNAHTHIPLPTSFPHTWDEALPAPKNLMSSPKDQCTFSDRESIHKQASSSEVTPVFFSFGA